MIYIIALILYIIIFFLDKNTEFVTKYYYSTDKKDRYRTLFPRKVWFVVLAGIIFIIPIANIIFPLAISITQFIYLSFDYDIVLKEGKLKSFVDFLNKDL